MTDTRRHRAHDLSREASDLRIATFRLARRMRTQRAVDSMSDGQFAVLAGLFIHGPHTLSELADRERVSAPAMNRTVNCLQDVGLRHPQRRRERRSQGRDRSDRRRPRRRRRDRSSTRRVGRGGARRDRRPTNARSSRRRPRSCSGWWLDERHVPLVLGVQLPRLVHRRARVEHRRVDAGDRAELGRPHRADRQRRRRDGRDDGPAVRAAAAAGRRHRLGRRPLRPAQAADGDAGPAVPARASRSAS